MTFETELWLRLITTALSTLAIVWKLFTIITFPPGVGQFVALGIYVLVWFALDPVFHN